MDLPKERMRVSVLMLAYNHEEYIAQALESVLMQQVNFDYELVIGDDCSSDETLAIISDYQSRNPDIIKLLPTEMKLGVNKNFARTLLACQGEYIAILEGDDYWTSPDKLRKQVDFLLSHPECSICCHNVLMVYEDCIEKDRHFLPYGPKEITTIEDLLKKNFIANCSVLFRRRERIEFPDWWYKVRNPDWPLHIFNAQHGHIGYINEVMAVYRKHQRGIWTSLGYIGGLQQWIITCQAVNAHLRYQYDHILGPQILSHWTKLEKIFIEQGFQLGQTMDGVIKVESIFDNWPSDLRLPNEWKNKVLAEIYERLLFNSFSIGDYKKARYCFARLVYYDPSRLNNIGLWSATSEAFLGKQIAGWLRKCMHKIREV